MFTSSVCRAQLSRSDRAKLVCRYRRHRPIFYIRPLKEELLNVDPKVVVLHDVVTDSEIAKIKEVSTPRVRNTSSVFTCIGALGTSPNRTGPLARKYLPGFHYR